MELRERILCKPSNNANSTQKSIVLITSPMLEPVEHEFGMRNESVKRMPWSDIVRLNENQMTMKASDAELGD